MDDLRKVVSAKRHPYRVIRKVVAVHKGGPYKGKAKVAKDRKSQYVVERVVAQGVHHCAAGRVCVRGNALIMPDGVQTYAKVLGPEDAKALKGRYVPDPKPYHWACLPEGAKYLRRFFWPKTK